MVIDASAAALILSVFSSLSSDIVSTKGVTSVISLFTVLFELHLKGIKTPFFKYNSILVKYTWKALFENARSSIDGCFSQGTILIALMSL